MENIKYGVKIASVYDECFTDEEHDVDLFDSQALAWEHMKELALAEAERESTEHNCDVNITLNKERGKISLFFLHDKAGSFYWIISGTEDEIYLI